MLFNSEVFLFAFLPVTYTVFWYLRRKTHRYAWLTLAGYVFYGFWDYRFCALMAFSTAVSYLAGRGFLAWNDPPRRRLCLILPITVDLALLGFFKYANFFLQNINAVAVDIGMPAVAPILNIVLPIGISFYTFHTISYIIDSYRGTVTPTRNLFEFSAYVSLFSQLVAGPIVRFGQIERDLENLDRADRASALNIGWSFFAIGMIEKVLIADTIAASIDPALKNVQQLSSLGAWLCAVGYTYQLFFDFSGYSNMAVGLGLLFGIRIPQNFNSPYKALNPSDFWSRWHISLSSCIRDYIYIPLGGNRRSSLRVTANLLVAMLLGGLWHGANWTFVVWGGYHGVLLVAYRLAGPHWDKLPRLVRQASMFLLVLCGWILFRSDDFGMAATWFGRLFSFTGGAMLTGAAGLGLAIAIAGALAHAAPNTFEIKHEWRPRQAAVLALLFLVCLGVIYAGKPSPFLYFQF